MNMQDMQQTFQELLVKAEQEHYMLEFRAMNQIYGSNVNFISDENGKFNYQDLLNLGYNHQYLNLHSLLVMNEQEAIGKTLKILFNENIKQQYLLLKLPKGNVIIHAEKSQATRTQLKFKIYPCDFLYNSLVFNEKYKFLVYTLMKSEDTKLNIESCLYNIERYGESFIISSYDNLKPDLYMSIMQYSNLNSGEQYKIYPIFFTEPLQIEHIERNLLFYQPLIHDWFKSKDDIDWLLNMFYKLMERKTDTMFIDMIVNTYFELFFHNYLNHQHNILDELSKKQAECFINYFHQKKMNSPNNKKVDFGLLLFSKFYFK